MDLKFLVGQNFSQKPEIKLLSADFFFTDKVPPAEMRVFRGVLK